MSLRWKVAVVLSLSIGVAGGSWGYAQSNAWRYASGKTPGAMTLTPQDYVEIYQLYSTYAYAIDAGDGQARAGTFVPEGTFVASANGRGNETMPQLAKRTTEQGGQGGRHITTNILITPTREGAKGSCYLISLSAKLTPPALTGNVGFYQDTLVKTAQGWRFKTREVWMDNEAGSPYRPKPRS